MRPLPLDLRDQLLNSRDVHLNGSRRIFRIPLFQCAIHIDAIIEIAGRLFEQLAQRAGNLRMIKRCVKPIFVGSDGGSDWPKKQRSGVVGS